MYTNKEQTEKLLAAGIVKDSCDMVVFAGRSKTDPFKDWTPVPKLPIIEKDAKKKVFTLMEKNWMPVWSDESLFDLLPTIINDPPNNKQYELHIIKRTIKGRGLFNCVGYFDSETGKPWRAFMNMSLTAALCGAVSEILCSEEYEPGNFLWE